MIRAALFVLLLLAFAVLLFPHESVVERYVARRAGPYGVEVAIGEARPALPLGYRLHGVEIRRGPFALAVDSLYLGAGRGVHAELCGGHVDGGPAETRGLAFVLTDIDPSRCVRLGPLTLATTVDGTVSLTDDGRAHVDLAAGRGTLSGHLPTASGAAGTAIGEWSFETAGFQGVIGRQAVDIKHARAIAEGLEIKVPQGRLTRAGAGTGTVQAEVHARAGDGSVRARAMLGLFPEASEQAGGWRHYRVTGSLAQPRVIGLR